ncbi:hypothetical protein T484DRAFT_1771972 [Baffinella frigidus]|nr:hypothetical protein T484DRAFT_1771972 [Cryptophyta sp. CCMP2293]
MVGRCLAAVSLAGVDAVGRCRVSGCLPRPTCLLLLSLLLGVIPTTTGDARDARDARDVEHLTVITSSPACYTLVTDTGTVGCRSTTPGGSEAPLVQLDSAAALGQFAAGALGAEGTVLLPFELFTRASMLDLKRSGRCRGVLLAAASSPPASFSPAPPLPYSKCDGGGSGAAWNPPGNSLSEMDFDFPIVWLSANETVKVQEKAAANKARGAGGFPRYVVRMRYAMDVFQVPSSVSVYLGSPIW